MSEYVKIKYRVKQTIVDNGPVSGGQTGQRVKRSADQLSGALAEMESALTGAQHVAEQAAEQSRELNPLEKIDAKIKAIDDFIEYVQECMKAVEERKSQQGDAGNDKLDGSSNDGSLTVGDAGDDNLEEGISLYDFDVLSGISITKAIVGESEGDNNNSIGREIGSRHSIFIARPLQSKLIAAEHGFVITTIVDPSGRHKITSRFSYGSRGASINDPLVNLTNTNDDVDKDDERFANQVIAYLNGDIRKLPKDVFISEIHAPDNLTQAVGKAVIGNPDYESVPSLFFGPGANSNSASVGISIISAYLAGQEFRVPEGATVPGQDQWRNLIINEKLMRRAIEICRKNGTC